MNQENKTLVWGFWQALENANAEENAQDAATSDYTLQHIRRFIFEGLNSYDQSELKSMGMADFFHPDVKWYGPGHRIQWPRLLEARR